MRVEMNITIDGQGTGDSWIWKNKSDFIKFLALIHNNVIADIYDREEPADFRASYVIKEDRYRDPIIKQYHYKRVEPQ